MFPIPPLRTAARRLSSLFAWVVLLVPSVVAADVHDDSFQPDQVLRISQQNITKGGIVRLTTLVNGTAPGPALRMTEDSVVWIRVYNDMKTENATVHWHGLAMAAYPFSDGTPGASQWPIPPSHYFDYQLDLPSGVAGTYFYHSHVGFQAVSASGPLIVEDKASPPYNVDGERIFHLQELFNKSDATIVAGLEANPFKFSGEINGFIVNGKTISNYGITDNATVQVATINVKPALRYRFRFIGAHSLTYASLGIEGHSSLSIIEADGSYTQPYPVEFLQVASGQRFSALLQTKSCDDLKQSGQLDYYIQVESRERPANTTNYAILRYGNDCDIPDDQVKRYSNASYPEKGPVILPPTVNGYLDYVLKPLTPNNFPTAANVSRRIIIQVQQVLNGWIIWRDSNVSWTDNTTSTSPQTIPQQPYLVSLYNDSANYLPSYKAAHDNNGVDPATQTFPGKIGEVLEIVLQNMGARALDNETGGSLDVHPWHAHGSHYYDIGGGPGLFDADYADRQLNGTEPVLRDTTMLFRYNKTVQPDAPNGWRAWRLRVTEPGVWMIHCHTLQHMIMGMQTVWVFGDQKQILALPKLDVAGYLTYGGSAYGNATHAPEVVSFSDTFDQSGSFSPNGRK